ncbi:MAG: hypothetical protein H7329_11820 [Opitutaceae bacterium]|nr:hypothetical protein [Cytophagales bacterium]
MLWDWVLIFSLLFAGLLFIIVEILFIPGTTIVGLFGLAFAITAIFSAYNIFGPTKGHFVLVGTISVFILAIYFSFRSEMWTQFANKTVNSSKVNEGLIIEIKIGMEGISVSDLKPVGRAEFELGIFEVTSVRNWINTTTLIRIVKIDHNKIFVEPLNV